MVSSESTLKSLSESGMLLPQEEMLEVGRKKSNLFIGIPRETSFQEHRVALAPDAVAMLAGHGHHVVVESQAGQASNFSDHAYSEAGAEIKKNAKDVFKADFILKVAPPSIREIGMMQHRQTLLSALQFIVQPKDFIDKLMDKKISAIAWDYMQDEDCIYPIVRAMGEIAGTTSILIAAEYLSRNEGQRAMLGGISGVAPTEVVVIGSGTVGEYATRAALGLGASVKVFDNNIYKLRRLQNDIGRRLYTSTMQPDFISTAIADADVAVGAIRAKQGMTPCVVTEDAVKKMKPGSVIVDVSIDQGGCFETSEVTNHEDPVFTKYDVTHYCVPNIPSRVPRTASHALSNIFAPILLNIANKGGIDNVIKMNKGIRHGVYMYYGTLTNQFIGERFNIPYQDIDLLMAAL
ncbi:MAG: alanine dehydrogenase [Flavobacteriales bacterium]